MALTGPDANCVIAVAVTTLLASCAGSPRPSVESPRLTRTDIEVLRVGLTSVVEPLLAVSAERVIVLTTSTRRLPLWQTPTSIVPFPPPSPFAGSRGLALPLLLPSRALDATLLSPEERVAWALRNREAREIPDMAIVGLGSRYSGGEVPVDWTVVSASAPCYSTTETAVLYAHYTCRGGCGEGQLIRLRRDGPLWRISASQSLWIG
jgi:hypothetical protein